MLLKGEVQMIHKMLKEGISKTEIARRLGIHRNTVRKYSNLPEGYIPTIKRKPAITIVDPFLPDIVRMLEEAHKLQVHIPISAVYKEIKKLGYQGGKRRVQEIVNRHDLRSRVEKGEVLLRFETDKGQQMQVDWVEFRKDGLSAFVATMGYSRTTYVEYVENEKVDTLIQCHINAFNYFGGVPKECLYDNMKTVITKRNAYGRGKHKFNEQFRDFAEKHCGITLKVCKPYRAQTKGKVERFNHYLRYSFHNLLKVRLSMMGYKLTLENANAEVLDWLDYDANARVHATTMQIPFDLLEEEQPYLLSLPLDYRGVHPSKVNNKSISEKDNSKDKLLVIPKRDLQVYDGFIPIAITTIVPPLVMGGSLWS